jgi:hypothetical protein
MRPGLLAEGEVVEVLGGPAVEEAFNDVAVGLARCSPLSKMSVFRSFFIK